MYASRQDQQSAGGSSSPLLDVRIWRRSCINLASPAERPIHLLRNATARQRRLHHHELAHVFRRQQTDQSLHAVEHGYRRTIALLHNPECFFKTCAGSNRGNIAPHHVAHAELRIVSAQGRNEIVPCEHTSHVSGFSNDWKIVLRSREESVDRFLERRVFWKGMEFAHQRARNRKPARNVFHLRESCFLRCTDVNEKCDEDQEWIPNQPDEPEDECKSLTDACRHLRRPRVTQSRCK